MQRMMHTDNDLDWFLIDIRVGLTLLPTHHIEAHGRNEDRSLDNVLHKIADVEQRHSVIEARHDEGAETCAEDRAAAAHKRSSADDAGGDGIEFL